MNKASGIEDLSWFRNLMMANTPALLAYARLLASGLALVSAPIVARAIGPEGRGETAAVAALIYLIPVALGIGLPAEVRRLSATGQARFAVVAARKLIFTVGAFIAICAAVILNATYFSSFETPVRIAATSGIIIAPMLISWACDNSVLVATKQFRKLFLLTITQPAIYLVLVATLWLCGSADPATVIGAAIIGLIAECVLGWLFVRPSRLEGSGYLPSYKSLLRNSIRYAGAAFADSASSRVGQIVALPLAGAYQAGLYAVAATVAAVPVSFGHAISASFYTRVALSGGRERERLHAEGVRASLAVALLTCLPLAAVLPVLIPLVFGSIFSGAIVAAEISTAGTIAMICGFVASSFLAAAGRGLSITVVQLSSLMVTVVLLIAIVPIYGAVGASFATASGHIALSLLAIIALKVRPSSVLPRRVDFRNALRILFREDKRK